MYPDWHRPERHKDVEDEIEAEQAIYEFQRVIQRKRDGISRHYPGEYCWYDHCKNTRNFSDHALHNGRGMEVPRCTVDSAKNSYNQNGREPQSFFQTSFTCPLSVGCRKPGSIC